MRYLLLLFTLLAPYDLLYAKDKEVSIYDFNITTISGKEISMSKYKGQVLLIVNVASECGFTPQYEELEKLYEAYREHGFMVLGFPSNQFAKQEPESNDKILFFCQSKYDVQFDMFAKIDVNGDNAIPLYKYLKSQKCGLLWTESIKWNFTKFLVDRSGHVVARYGSASKPESLKEDIEALLKR
jgi:glutathione peroxidase